MANPRTEVLAAVQSGYPVKISAPGITLRAVRVPEVGGDTSTLSKHLMAVGMSLVGDLRNGTGPFDLEGPMAPPVGKSPVSRGNWLVILATADSLKLQCYGHEQFLSMMADNDDSFVGSRPPGGLH